ncbi:hypothetical protein [uncultured Sneathiella sp.]|uniref:hypothetical protein n=1 Tax=uncultured Sneathiella sp. TaxID=879315 RepID=UPI0030DB19D6
MGASENVTQFADLFKGIDRKHHIFQKTDEVITSAPFSLLWPNSQAINLPTRSPTANQQSLQNSFERGALERFTSAHIIVNRDGDVVYYSLRTGKYLEPAHGAASRQLLDMARKDVRLDLRNALHECMQSRTSVKNQTLQLMSAISFNLFH